jgi:hypothetical protein
MLLGLRGRNRQGFGHWSSGQYATWQSRTGGSRSGIALTGPIVVCFGRFLGPWSPVPKCEAPGAPISVQETTFEVFTGVGSDNSLERLTERSVGLVTDRPSDVYELLVTLL